MFFYRTLPKTSLSLNMTEESPVVKMSFLPFYLLNAWICAFGKRYIQHCVVPQGCVYALPLAQQRASTGIFDSSLLYLYHHYYLSCTTVLWLFSWWTELAENWVVSLMCPRQQSVVAFSDRRVVLWHLEVAETKHPVGCILDWGLVLRLYSG